ncbi:ubiquitin carboxyl-terminal hydrolase 15-like [Paramacrobiotus metropolitanus]|uniref:ubiquitin carboxyl-terminal hydrolase 15-like n=1 Tax=Paramacrobiotus metropolitanus TaxID=2943436 RepID=UPI002445B227|nr:ubiquitin carboxyl-terminal hydrolase 15-like [Paramacrobiotus metropolitanus]
MVQDKIKTEPDSSTMDVDNQQELDAKGLLKEMEDAEKAYPYIAGEDWYIISTKWRNQLKKYLEENAENPTTNPGPIDNSEIIERVDNVNYVKPDDVVTREEFEFLPERLWKKLAARFGCVESLEKQEILARVYESSPLNFQIEARPLIVECCLYPDIQKIEKVRVRRGSTIRECVQDLFMKFAVESKKCRLWLYHPDGTLDMPEPNPDKRVNELDLSIHHLVILEVGHDENFELDNDKAKDRLRDGLRMQRNAANRPVEEKKSYNLRSSQQNRSDISSWSIVSRLDDSSSQQPGLVGLGNLGNTCFMNSSLQCISNIPELTKYFVTKDYEKDLNTDNPLGKGGEVAKTYADLVTQIWMPSRGGVIYPSKFKSIMSRYTHLFNGAQQDSQESMQFIIDCLHEDLNRIRKKPYKEQNDEEDPNKSDAEKASESWEAYTARNSSVIVDLFCGQVRSVLKCPDCKKTSTTFDPMMYYSLPLPSNQMRKIVYTFIPYKVNLPPIKKSVNVSKIGTFNDLLAEVSKQVDTVPPDCLMACDLHENRVVTVYQGTSSIDTLGERTRLYVYELPCKVNDEEKVPVVVYIRKIRPEVSSSYFSSSNMTIYDIPFVIAVPKKGMRSSDLYVSLYLKLLPRLGPHANLLKKEETVNIGDSSEPNLTNGNADDVPTADVDGNSMDEEIFPDNANSQIFNAILAAPKIFSVCTINQNGSVSLDEIKMNQKARVSFKTTHSTSQAYLAMDFRGEILDKLFMKAPEPVMDLDKNVTYGRTPETVDLKDCFRLFLKQEKLGEANMWRCPFCKEEKCAVKKLDLYKMPQYMFVHLKRFQYNRFYREKLNTKVKFPVTGLDISDLVINRDERPVVYDLVGQSCHSGGLGGGHYWAVCRNEQDQKWYNFNDSSVRPADHTDMESETTPYILVFRRRAVKDCQTSSDSNEPSNAQASMDVDSI